jgi:hypothetical protein
MIDGDWLKEFLWKFELEEQINYFLLAAGIDSVYFMFTFGLPLYLYAAGLALALILPLINLGIESKCSTEPD